MDRRNEWFVPDFGPAKFRIFIGLLFLPYTGMVLAHTMIGSMLAERIFWDRVAAILLIYFLALGIGAHALDALGSETIKPWGNAFSKRQLWWLAGSSITAAYVIGIYYMILYVPLLWIVAILEGFFLLAYNLEWFNGQFHTDGWFAFSWGSLPVLAGYILQTNSVTMGVILIAVAMGLLSLVEIKASRPYKEIKRQLPHKANILPDEIALWLECVLKYLSCGVILLGVGLLCWRWVG